MRNPAFHELRQELERGGVAQFYVRRALLELGEHYDDLRTDALASGMSSDEADRYAQASLGAEHAIAAAILARAELLDWCHRWPRVAVCLRSAAVVAALPGMPVMFCVDHGREIGRWGLLLTLALFLMSSMLYSLNLLIVTG